VADEKTLPPGEFTITDEGEGGMDLVLGLMLGWAPLGLADEVKSEKAQELQKVEAKAEEAKEPEKPQWNVQTDILSQYVWRGIALIRGSAVIQPSITGTYKGIAVNVWNNFDTSEQNPFSLTRPMDKKMRWNETDLTFSYTREVFKNLNLTAGVIYYILSGANSLYNSVEIYGGADYKLPWLNFGFGVYREVNHFPGTFLQWYIHRAIDIPWIEGMNLDLFASWSAEFSNDKAAYPVFNSAGDLENKFYQSLHAGYLAVALNIPLGKYVVVAPKVQYWYGLGGQSTATLNALSWDRQHNHILGGLNLAVNF
jgi:hypothetical protein